MPFDYSKSGLPANPKWHNAAGFCKGGLDQNMTMFGPERIESFMLHQPVAAAKLIMDNCPDYSEESITLALLGPAKGLFLENERGVAVMGQIFGARTVALLKYMAGKGVAGAGRGVALQPRDDAAKNPSEKKGPNPPKM